MTELSQAVRILRELEANNSKAWFDAHRHEVDSELIRHSRAAAHEVRDLLEKACQMNLETKVYRLNRDLRFSKDKSPYNTHFRFSMWPAGREQGSSVCFHFSIETGRLTCGVGLWDLGHCIDDFRARCFELEALLTEAMRLSEPELKRVPARLAPPPALAKHFRRKGLTVWIDRDHSKDEPICFEPESVSALVPIFNWFSSLVDQPGQ